MEDALAVWLLVVVLGVSSLGTQATNRTVATSTELLASFINQDVDHIWLNNDISMNPAEWNAASTINVTRCGLKRGTLSSDIPGWADTA